MSDYDVTEAMIQYGGGFVQGLGRLFRQADRGNQIKLRDAFPGYFAKYRELAGFEDASSSLDSQEPR